MVLEKTLAFAAALKDIVESDTGHARELSSEIPRIGSAMTDRNVRKCEK
jgi:hypothetical protein